MIELVSVDLLDKGSRIFALEEKNVECISLLHELFLRHLLLPPKLFHDGSQGCLNISLRLADMLIHGFNPTLCIFRCFCSELEFGLFVTVERNLELATMKTTHKKLVNRAVCICA